MPKFGRDEDPQVREPLLQEVGREPSHRQGSLEPVVKETNNNLGLGQNVVMELCPTLECRGTQELEPEENTLSEDWRTKWCHRSQVNRGQEVSGP